MSTFFSLPHGSNFDLSAAPDRSAPRIYDFNGDGLKDVIVGELNGYVYYLKNSGAVDADNFPVFNSADKLLLAGGTPLRAISSASSTVPRSRIDVVDWNNDGLPDIVLGQSDGRAMLFTAAPEPMSTTLFIAGGSVLGLSRLRRKFKGRSK